MAACKNGKSFPSDFFNQPWIIQCHGGNKHTTTFIDPKKINVEEKEIYEIKGKLCFGCIDEWLFLWDEQSKECFFLELNSLSKVPLPPLPREYNIMTTFSLSSSPNHSDCIIIFTGAKFELETNEVTERFIMCCRLHDEKWTKLLLDEDDQRLVGETCVILDGKLYAYGIDEVIVFDVMSLLEGRIDTTTITGPIMAIYPPTDMVSTHLVGSCGHIYLVRMYKYGMGPTINMDIYRLDTSSDKWSRVNSIGERTFFLSHRCYTSVCALDVGVPCNCIYYVPLCSEKERRIYKFCLDDHTMTFSLLSIEQTEHESSVCWFVPRR
ncbi:F-box/kelch-repeat protein [Carex littledalei]|uniref:F-box/kelch-repeat protein n=1 Tax=Carex littledalei TaxID=544730 RepID=A0A833QRV1_9POAL|nr:F-box/kelch-repeat protein [Carex littledalei]